MSLPTELGQAIPKDRTSNETNDQLPFMTPKEFDFVTTEHLASVVLENVSDANLASGYRGTLMRGKKMIIDETGKPEEKIKYTIKLAANVSREEMALEFLELLDSIRRNEDIVNNGSITLKLNEIELRRVKLKQRVQDFYHANQKLVDSYLARMRKNPEFAIKI